MAVRRQPGKPYYNERKSGLVETLVFSRSSFAASPNSGLIIGCATDAPTRLSSQG